MVSRVTVRYTRIIHECYTQRTLRTRRNGKSVLLQNLGQRTLQFKSNFTAVLRLSQLFSQLLKQADYSDKERKTTLAIPTLIQKLVRTRLQLCSDWQPE